MDKARRIVVITGSSGGIGRASAVAFGRQGATVALLARGEAGLAGAAREVEAAGGRAWTLSVDVADANALDAAAERIERELGPIDVWVNVAFTSVFSPFSEITAGEFARVTEVSYLGYVYGQTSALKRMPPRNRGVIVQVGSALAYRASRCRPPTAARNTPSRDSMNRCGVNCCMSRADPHHDGANAGGQHAPVFLGPVPPSAQAQPVPPIYQPEVAARAVVYAADHPKRREYWVGGSTAGTLIANAVAPGLLDRYLAKTGFNAQQTAEPRHPDQPENLWEPADAAKDFGMRGIFDSRASNRSAQLWASQHHAAVGASAAGAPRGRGDRGPRAFAVGDPVKPLEVVRAAYGMCELLAPDYVSGGYWVRYRTAGPGW